MHQTFAGGALAALAFVALPAAQAAVPTEIQALTLDNGLRIVV